MLNNSQMYFMSKHSSCVWQCHEVHCTSLFSFTLWQWSLTLQWHQWGRHPSQHQSRYEALHASRSSGRDSEQKSFPVIYHGRHVQLRAHPLGDRSTLRLRRYLYMDFYFFTPSCPLKADILSKSWNCVSVLIFCCNVRGCRYPWRVPVAVPWTSSYRPFIWRHERGGLHQETTAILP